MCVCQLRGEMFSGTYTASTFAVPSVHCAYAAQCFTIAVLGLGWDGVHWGVLHCPGNWKPFTQFTHHCVRPKQNQIDCGFNGDWR